jgi:hypothetical protein
MPCHDARHYYTCYSHGCFPEKTVLYLTHLCVVPQRIYLIDYVGTLGLESAHKFDLYTRTNVFVTDKGENDSSNFFQSISLVNRYKECYWLNISDRLLNNEGIFADDYT